MYICLKFLGSLKAPYSKISYLKRVGTFKAPLLSGFACLAVLGICQQGKAYNLQACIENPMISTPEVINLLQPLDQRMINCIPSLDSIASQWRARANQIQSSIGQVRIGNQGNTSIEKLEYNIVGNTINLVARVQARHTWSVNVPAVRERVPVDKYRWVEVPYPDVRMERRCRLGVCVNVPVPFTNHRRERVPYVEMEWRTITPARTVSETASTTCTYNYSLNLSTTEGRPVFSCGRGSLGTYKLDASAITSILNGQMPSLSSLITSISITPPLFRDANHDTYDETRNRIIASHPGSIVYFSSASFVRWASVENHSASALLTLVSGGSYSAEFMRQVEEKLRIELAGISSTLSQAAISLGSEQIMSMMTGSGSANLNGYSISVKVVETPEIIQKCVVSTGDCTPAIESPRLGFAIIATPNN
ncbi:hypothetical protein [Nodosilinea sp. E11]|uniref:hypothetical protein n=1 Tax=Nodosilinea sp. E11 TaxID=3037479 RepID=UPI002934F2B1|nr:hypothetical protein [Nodosilinea sp. E11]WOD37469.1 hypothetical protein RRF56_14770 [Nodosilinea sp. E11]